VGKESLGEKHSRSNRTIESKRRDTHKNGRLWTRKKELQRKRRGVGRGNVDAPYENGLAKGRKHESKDRSTNEPTERHHQVFHKKPKTPHKGQSSRKEWGNGVVRHLFNTTEGGVRTPATRGTADQRRNRLEEGKRNLTAREGMDKKKVGKECGTCQRKKVRKGNFHQTIAQGERFTLIQNEIVRRKGIREGVQGGEANSANDKRLSGSKVGAQGFLKKVEKRGGNPGE